jgi:NAD-dependent DNA ligase
MAEIEKSRDCQLHEFMGSIGINFLGRRQAEILIGQGIDTVEKFLDLTVEQLCGMDGFKKAKIQECDEDGDVVGETDAPVSTKATGIVEGIRKALPLIEELRKQVRIVAAKEPEIPKTGGKLSGLTFCFTGAIEREENGKRFTRKMMWDVVRANGGAPSEDVEKSVTYLVQADPDSTSSKTKKATKLGVKVLSEADFWKMVE